MAEFSDVINEMYELAEIEGAKQVETAWLWLGHVWWPNPHYKGEPAQHPEADNVFHPEKGPSLRERYAQYQEEQNK